MLYAAYAFSVAAILVMAFDVFQAFKLKGSILGGEVGKKWNLLTTLLVIFFVCYLASPLVLVLDLGIDVMGVLVFFVFLFGAVFVWVVIGIIRDTLSFLDMLKKD